MTESRGSNNKIKVHQFPLAIQVNPNLGILNFPSQSNNVLFEKPVINLTPHQQDITYKSAVGRQQESQEEEQQTYTRKKVVYINKITIKPQNLRKKYFRVDIPLNKTGYGATRNKQKMHFVIEFGQDNKGTLTMVEDMHECQMEIATSTENKLTFEEKMKAQDARLDARRRQQKIELIEQKKDGRKKQK